MVIPPGVPVKAAKSIGPCPSYCRADCPSTQRPAHPPGACPGLPAAWLPAAALRLMWLGVGRQLCLGRGRHQCLPKSESSARFEGEPPNHWGRPSYHPSILLKLYVYGYLNRVQSSRRLEREAGRNVEVMWLTGRLVPDHKTIADFRKDSGPAIRKVCAQFVALCRELGLLMSASVAIDGSKFKAVNNRDKNFTRAKMERRLAQIEESVARYLSQLDTADLQDPTEALAV